MASLRQRASTYTNFLLRERIGSLAGSAATGVLGVKGIEHLITGNNKTAATYFALGITSAAFAVLIRPAEIRAIEKFEESLRESEQRADSNAMLALKKAIGEEVEVRYFKWIGENHLSELIPLRGKLVEVKDFKGIKVEIESKFSPVILTMPFVEYFGNFVVASVTKIGKDIFGKDRLLFNNMYARNFQVQGPSERPEAVDELLEMTFGRDIADAIQKEQGSESLFAMREANSKT